MEASTNTNTMRNRLFIFLLLSVLTATGEKVEAQDDCSSYILTHEDEVDGTILVASRFPIKLNSSEGIISINWFNTPDKAYALSITCNDESGCIDNGDKINILFTNGDRLELYNQKKFNCEGRSLTILRIGDSTRGIIQLREKRIKIIRVWMGDNYIQQEFSTVDAILFQNILNCLINYNASH